MRPFPKLLVDLFRCWLGVTFGQFLSWFLNSTSIRSKCKAFSFFIGDQRGGGGTCKMNTREVWSSIQRFEVSAMGQKQLSRSENSKTPLQNVSPTFRKTIGYWSRATCQDLVWKQLELVRPSARRHSGNENLSIHLSPDSLEQNFPTIRSTNLV